MKRILFYLLIVTALGTACNPARKLAENEVLLLKTKVKTDKSKYSDGLKSIIKQKPNRKMLGLLRFNLGVYNLFANTNKDSLNWISRTIGEEPVVLDTVLTKRTTKQMELYMQNRGFFNSEAKDTTTFHGRKNNKAKVYYVIRSKDAYTIKDIIYNIVDTGVAQIVIADKKNSLLKKNQNFDTKVIQSERDRISILLKNNGYYFFNQQYVTFRVDSSLKKNQVRIFIDIAPEIRVDPATKEASVVPHTPYLLNNIYIRTDYDPLLENLAPVKDTIIFNNYTFLSTSGLKQHNHCVLSRCIFISKGNLFRLKELERSYEKLADLGVFKFVNIEFYRDTSAGLENNLLNVNVYLTPRKKQDYSYEIEGTRSGSDFGISSNIVYRNKNTFNGSELLQVKLRGSVEVTKNLANDDTDKKGFIFNTYEIGPEISLTIPKLLLPFIGCRETKSANAFTVFNANYNLEDRPEFRRTILNFNSGLGYKFNRTSQFRYYPIDYKFVDVTLTDDFRDLLISSSDPGLIDRFEDHLIPSGRLTYIYNDQQLGKSQNFTFLKADLSSASFLLSFVKTKKSNDGENQVLGIQYSQFIKPEFDFRHYRYLYKRNIIVFRLNAGLGIPYDNSTSLPYEESFWGGGPNDLRAFRTRKLGPGGYDEDNKVQQNGEIKLGSNIEYRFNIIRFLKGAAFIDAGNIWLKNEDSSKPDADFNTNRFLDEIAIGTGLGLRWDFTYFIFRLDGAIKVKDPSNPKGNRYVLQNTKVKDINLNIGIGYPF